MRKPALAVGFLLLAGCTSGNPQPEASISEYRSPVAEPVFTQDGINAGATGQEIDFNRAEPGVITAMSKLMGAGPVSVGAACSGLREARWKDGTALYFEPRAYDPAAFVGWQHGAESAGRTCAT
ncbi:hypothetical protein [Aliiruegeria lutimaris]|uniref:Uncharacterized protein n=1 Tax=Aliiruegeria lutimaris TaxID=571298 RepID=A0A1G8N9F7_9RHOB|nr:hypothetical protein [Aliiruegeria lutimaris]SDI76864.1 hypothetical protein SAMN04488026_10077 [Aliiruegeria lutimaris]